MPKLQIILTSTRDARQGPPVAQWFFGKAQAHGKFELEPVDLKEVNLPLFDEPHHPMKKQYVHEHTKAWSRLVAPADAFVWVMPEYNYGMPPAMLNALEYLHDEWKYKPCGFVSYGGVSGGTRSVQMAKPILTSLSMMPIPPAVSLPFFAKQIQDGKFNPGDVQDTAVTNMLNELLRWTTALKTMR